MGFLKFETTLKVVLFVLILPQILAVDTKENDPLFIQNIWREILETGMEQKLMKTTFIKGIKSGMLDIMCWSRYIVQDLEFVFQQYRLVQRACDDGAEDPYFSQFCQIFQGNYRVYYQQIKKYLYISTIDLIDPFKDYIEDNIKTYEKNTYHYIAIINYACLKIYNSIPTKFLQIANKQSPYFSWIEMNSNYMFYQDLEKIINFYQNHFDKEQVKQDILRLFQRQIEIFEVSCPFYENENEIKLQ